MMMLVALSNNQNKMIIMKALTNILRATFALCTALSLTSCLDDDEIKSSIITGEWRGDFGMYYEYECHTCGHSHTFYSDDTHLVFYPSHNYSTHGYGYQSDYYNYGPYRYQYYYFRWEMTDGVLYIDYPYDSYLNTEIYSYHMTDDVFTGKIGDNGGSFHLYKVADISDWSTCYDHDYYYEVRYNWHSTANRALSADSIATADNEETGCIIKRGNKLTQNND